MKQQILLKHTIQVFKNDLVVMAVQIVSKHLEYRAT